MKHNKFILVLAVLSLVLAACGAFWQPPTTPLTDDAPNTANGEQIYFTANSQRDGQITFTGGSAFGGMMMGSYLTCASCHGPTARGGRHIMHMETMDAPDIRYVALSSELDEHGGGHDEYDLETFRRAVVDGQHPDGELLDSDMPHWQMSDADLADLFAFLQSIP
ncbi:MAG: cytochrome c [Chloroflexi bacterium]|nr:cytochrome c [Chloroflexota bacterium]MBU1662173.1 cytochrome c [Chloroflexota bacterium]